MPQRDLRPRRLVRLLLMAATAINVAQGVEPEPKASSDPRAKSPSAIASTPPPRQSHTRAPAPGKPREQVLGGDVSWPQCPKGMGIPERPGQGLPMPKASAEFIIIGLTNGPAFVANPCLESQFAEARARHLKVATYAVATYPDRRRLAQLRHQGPYDGDTKHGGLGNVGYQEAKFNVATMARVNLQTPFVWIDVEPYPLFPWSADKRANAAVVRGIVRGYTEAGYRVGFYSVQSLWHEVVGNLRLGLPEWRTAGATTKANALVRCGPAASFQGGPGIIGQWYTQVRDFDVTCPGTSAEMDRWFHQY